MDRDKKIYKYPLILISKYMFVTFHYKHSSLVLLLRNSAVCKRSLSITNLTKDMSNIIQQMTEPSSITHELSVSNKYI